MIKKYGPSPVAFNYTYLWDGKTIPLKLRQCRLWQTDRQTDRLRTQWTAVVIGQGTYLHCKWVYTYRKNNKRTIETLGV